MAVEAVAQVFNNALADIFHQIAVTEIDQPADNEHADNDERQNTQRVQVFCGKDVVKDVLDHKRERSARHTEDHHAAQGQKKTGADRDAKTAADDGRFSW